MSADLTFIGEKPAERFDFSQIEHELIQADRPLSMLSWHYEHFLNPEAVVSGSKMPFVQYSKEEAMALAMLMMSWKDINLPIMLIPEGEKEEQPVAEEETVKGELSPAQWGRELFASKNCAECHTIGEGVEIGPDLKGVDKIRDIEWLRKMIGEPEKMEQTDPLAQKLYQEYEELGMPTEALTEEEVEAIIEYIKSFEK